MEHPPLITELEVQQLRETMLRVRDRETPMPNEFNYPQMDLILQEGQINREDPEGEPVSFIDIAVDKAKEADVAAALRESLRATNEESGLPSGATEDDTGMNNVSAFSSA